jgi:magnesium chelatase subunit D
MGPTPNSPARHIREVPDHHQAQADAQAQAEAQAERALARWADARLIAALLAVNPVGLGGAHVQAAPSAVRDEWLRVLQHAMPAQVKVRRLPANADESRLLGGMDLSATLRGGRPVLQAGLLSELDGGVLVCPMAERLPRRVVAFLSQALDRGELRVEREGMGLDVPTRLAVVALDESLPHDEEHRLEPALRERLAFSLSLEPQDWRGSGLSPLDPPPDAPWDDDDMKALQAARCGLDQVEVPEEVVSALVQAADALGVESVRAPWWALQAVRTLAALRGLNRPGAEEVRDAARLVLGPRATRLPAAPPADAPEEEPLEGSASEPPDPTPDPSPPEPAQAPEAQAPDAQAYKPEQRLDTTAPPPATPEPLDDLWIEAIQAALPAGLLALMAQQNGLSPRGRKSGEASSRAGQRQARGAQGRPSGTFPGMPQAGQRLSLIDTLRQAAPWQRLRRAQHTRRTSAVIVHREDLRVIRREPRRPTTTVFVVDASGSNALNRLAEAKGAVETLLADCYVRRDRVAVIGFRGQAAETLLPPTRSLVRAKRSLAGLPGGGGTPMALALTESRLVCESLQRRGDTVSLVLLTDGKANINLEGKPGRDGAHADAVSAARQLFVTGVACLLIDTSPKPQAQARELALAMGARYIPLPQAQAGEIGRIVRNSRPS